MQTAEQLKPDIQPMPWHAKKKSWGDPRTEAVAAFREFADCLEARAIDFGNVQWCELPTMPFLVRMFARAPRDGMDGIRDGFKRTEMMRQRGPVLMREGPALPPPLGTVQRESTEHCAEYHVPIVETELETTDPLADAVRIARDVATRLETRELQGAVVSYYADESGVYLRISEAAWGRVARTTRVQFMAVTCGQ